MDDNYGKTGKHLELARNAVRIAKTADELPSAQGHLLLPLELGLSLEQTAIAIGRSKGKTCTLRTNYCKRATGRMAAPVAKRDLRNRANLSLDNPIKLLEVESKELGKYGDSIGQKVCGVQTDTIQLLTRPHQWRIERRSAKCPSGCDSGSDHEAAFAAQPPWSSSSVNNSTQNNKLNDLLIQSLKSLKCTSMYYVPSRYDEHTI